MSRKTYLISITSEGEKTTEKVKGLFKDNKITYYEKNKTKVDYNLNNHKLTRENNEMKLVYLFSSKKTKGNIYIKEFNKKIEIDIKTISLEENINKISIDFYTGDKNILYVIEVIE